MDRRKFLSATAGFGAGLALMGAGAFAQNAEKPNIIIIIADDLGWGDLGCYGSPAISTPNIDRLADEGVRMTSFFSSSAVCSASRAGLLTGRYPRRTGVNFVFVPKELFPIAALDSVLYDMPLNGLPSEEITTAYLLKTGGYSTCCIGKWHLGDLKKYRPTSRGFDHYYGVLHSNDVMPLKLYADDEVVEPSPVDQDYLTQKYTGEAVKWIEDNHNRPFFMYFAHTSPHVPLHASPEFRGKSKGGLYGDCVEELDWSTGRILETLDRLGIAENTFVFFTSDNGPWFQGSTGMFRGRKGETFDGGMRVPGIARWPGIIPAGTTTDEISMNFDLFSTSLAIAGLDIPADRIVDGTNIIPMLAGEAPSPHNALYFYQDKKLQAVRSGKWKYRRRHSDWVAMNIGPNRFMSALGVTRKRGPMLFNTRTDFDESYNVIDLYPEVALKLERMMVDWEKNFTKGFGCK